MVERIEPFADEGFLTELTTPLLLRLPESPSYASKPLLRTWSSGLLECNLAGFLLDFESRTPILSEFNTVPILSPSLLPTVPVSSLDTSLLTSALEGREEEDVALFDSQSDSLVVLVTIFLDGFPEEIFLTVGELEVTVLDGAIWLPEVFARLMILLRIGDTSSTVAGWALLGVLMGVLWVLMEGL